MELSTIIILLGANNSGKTTILEALFLASNLFRIVSYNLDNSPSMAVSIIENLLIKLSEVRDLLFSFIVILRKRLRLGVKYEKKFG